MPQEVRFRLGRGQHGVALKGIAGIGRHAFPPTSATLFIALRALQQSAQDTARLFCSDAGPISPPSGGATLRILELPLVKTRVYACSRAFSSVTPTGVSQQIRTKLLASLECKSDAASSSPIGFNHTARPMRDDSYLPGARLTSPPTTPMIAKASSLRTENDLLSMNNAGHTGRMVQTHAGVQHERPRSAL